MLSTTSKSTTHSYKETITFWALIGTLLATATCLFVEGFPWPGRGYLVDSPMFSGFDNLSAHASVVLAAVHAMTIVLSCIGLAALTSKSITMMRILAFVPLVAITHVIDLVRFGILFLAAGIFVISWAIPKLARFRATSGHMATGATLAGASILAAFTHAFILFPSYETRDQWMADAAQIAAITQGPAEIEKLIEAGVLHLDPITPDRLGSYLESEKAPAAVAEGATLEKIISEAPPIVHSWILEGWEGRWKAMVLYDGRGETPKSWVLDPDWSNRPILDALSQMALIFGLTVPLWGIFTLIVIRSRSRVENLEAGNDNNV